MLASRSPRHLGPGHPRGPGGHRGRADVLPPAAEAPSLNPIDVLAGANWDAFRDINGRHIAPLNPLMVTAAQDLIVLAPLLVLALWFGFARWSPVAAGRDWRALGQRAALAAAGAAVVALALNAVVGHLVFVARPFVTHPALDRLLVAHAADNSFPSDHEAVAAAVATVLGLLARRARRDGDRGGGWVAVIALLAVATAALIGFARVYVGVHYPFDIAGGALVGIVAGALLWAAIPTLEPLLGPAIRLAERLRLA